MFSIYNIYEIVWPNKIVIIMAKYTKYRLVTDIKCIYIILIYAYFKMVKSYI